MTSRRSFTARDRHSFWSSIPRARSLMPPALPAPSVLSTDVSYRSLVAVNSRIYNNLLLSFHGESATRCISVRYISTTIARILARARHHRERYLILNLILNLKYTHELGVYFYIKLLRRDRTFSPNVKRNTGSRLHSKVSIKSDVSGKWAGREKESRSTFLESLGWKINWIKTDGILTKIFPFPLPKLSSKVENSFGSRAFAQPPLIDSLRLPRNFRFRFMKLFRVCLCKSRARAIGK